MNPPPTFETRLQSTGTTLRDRPSIVDRVMAEVRQTVAQAPRPQDQESRQDEVDHE